MKRQRRRLPTSTRCPDSVNSRTVRPPGYSVWPRGPHR